MTIQQSPDSLSLSGNIKDIILTGVSGPVPFSLSVDSTQILEHVYYPDSDGRIIIDIRRFVEEQLSFNLTYGTNPWEQTLLTRSFSFTAGDLAPQTFTAIRAGIDNPGETASNWLRSNFLTWQPTVKHVTYATPELLTYYAQSACRVRIKVYYPDGTSSLLTAIPLTAGVWTIPVSYAVIASLLGYDSYDDLIQAEQLPGAYDVWIEDTSGNRLTYVQRYIAGNTRESEQWVLFENSLGGVDCFRAYGNGSVEAEHEHQTAEFDESVDEYRVDTVRRIRKSTGWMNIAERRWMLDFFPARHRWICEGGVFRSIVLTEDSVSYTIDNMPAEFEFTFRYATNLTYLNVPRLLVPPSVVNIIAPDLQSFSLPPRLVEFPRLSPSEGGLIPVQSPYSDNWSALSLDEILEYIGHITPGFGHTHANKSVLDQIGTDSDFYLWLTRVVSGVTQRSKAKAGDADKWAGKNFSEYMNQPVRTTDQVSFAKVLADIIGSKLFMPGLLGHGWKIDSSGNGELDSLSLRKWLEVPELRYNRVSIYIGVRWDTFGGGIIESVVPDAVVAGTGTGTLKLENGDIGAIAVGDLCMGIWHDTTGNDTENADDNKGNFTFAGFKTVYFQITAVSGAHNENFSYVLRSAVDGGNGIHPFVGMHFAGRGNTTDETRQAFSYTTTRYSLSLSGVSTWEFQPANYIEIHGNLEGFSMPAISPSGQPYTKEFHGYGQVFGNAYLFGQIDQFERQAFRMVIDQSLGGSLAPDETEDVTVTVLDGYGSDVTERFTLLSVTRNSGDAPSDAVWNAAHTSVDNPFQISFSDLGIDGIHSLVTTFTVTATDETSDSNASNTIDFFS